MVAEGNDELMEEFFDKGTIAEEHLVAGLRRRCANGAFIPCCSLPGWGTSAATACWTSSSTICRRPPTAPRLKGAPTTGNGEPPRRKVADAEPVSLYVFKTVADPFAGRV